MQQGGIDDDGAKKHVIVQDFSNFTPEHCR